jgi:integrative and conjugative element protein (TIGR02256 family)
MRHEVCRALAASAKKYNSQPEAGGIFLGTYRGNDIEVVGRTMPGPDDTRTFFSFLREDPTHQTAATEAWKISGRTQTFVGEWHTHPVGGVEPSSIDIATWKRIARDQRRPMVFALAAPGGWGLFLASAGTIGTKIFRLSISEHGRMGLVFSALPHVKGIRIMAPRS